jgi:hypothetical protein
MKRRVSIFTPLLAVVLAGIFFPGESSARPPASSKCATGEHRQFDFWAGDWDAYGLDEGNKLVARARVDVILDGCALLEVYEQLDGLTGQSFSIYDPSRGTWHQTWVTNRGKLLTLEGRFQDGRMTLTGTDRRTLPIDSRRLETSRRGSPRDRGDLGRQREELEASLRHPVPGAPAGLEGFLRG